VSEEATLRTPIPVTELLVGKQGITLLAKEVDATVSREVVNE
jgi:hypothetical protein